MATITIPPIDTNVFRRTDRKVSINEDAGGQRHTDVGPCIGIAIDLPAGASQKDEGISAMSIETHPNASVAGQESLDAGLSSPHPTMTVAIRLMEDGRLPNCTFVVDRSRNGLEFLNCWWTDMRGGARAQGARKQDQAR